MYQSSTPATLRRLEIRVVSGCVALLQLALYPDEDRTTRETQVRIDAGGPWLTVCGPAFCSEPGYVDNQPLLRPDQLTIERYAQWIALHSKLDGLTWVVARPYKGAVQTRLLSLATLIEGFHRELPYYQKAEFAGVVKAVLNGIFEAAQAAALAKAVADELDPSLTEKVQGQDNKSVVEDAVAFYTEVSFQDRAKAIVAEVCSVVPEIVESIANLPQRIRNAPNELAHRPTAGARSPLETRVLEWLVVAEATSWLLRCLLLLRAGIDGAALHERLLFFQRFGFFRANTAQHVSELNWELPTSD